MHKGKTKKKNKEKKKKRGTRKDWDIVDNMDEKRL
jgi:hypothetical protein